MHTAYQVRFDEPSQASFAREMSIVERQLTETLDVPYYAYMGYIIPLVFENMYAPGAYSVKSWRISPIGNPAIVGSAYSKAPEIDVIYEPFDLPIHRMKAGIKFTQSQALQVLNPNMGTGLDIDFVQNKVRALVQKRVPSMVNEFLFNGEGPISGVIMHKDSDISETTVDINPVYNNDHESIIHFFNEVPSRVAGTTKEGMTFDTVMISREDYDQMAVPIRNGTGDFYSVQNTLLSFILRENNYITTIIPVTQLNLEHLAKKGITTPLAIFYRRNPAVIRCPVTRPKDWLPFHHLGDELWERTCAFEYGEVQLKQPRGMMTVRLPARS